MKKKPKKKPPVHRAVIPVPIKTLRRHVKRLASVADAPPPTEAALVIVDDLGKPLGAVPVPPSEWQKIWDACVEAVKGALR